MSYKTELHCHSMDVSNCATETVEYIAERYAEAGYNTVVLTNHINGSTYSGPRYIKYLEENGIEDTWDHRIDYFMRDYHRLVKASNGRFHVILGLELRLICDHINDYLIFGVTEDWLRRSEIMTRVKLKEMSRYVHESGLLIYQAHPFRNGITVVKPEFLDGYEIYNGHMGHRSRNDFAEAWAKFHNKPGISGTDFHHGKYLICAGIETDEPITNTDELMTTLRSQNYRLIRDLDLHEDYSYEPRKND